MRTNVLIVYFKTGAHGAPYNTNINYLTVTEG